MTIRPALVATLLAALTFAAPARASDMSNLSDADRAAFRDEVRAYLLDNPEVLMEAIAVLESREAEAQAANDGTLIQTNAAAIFEDNASWIGGNAEGDVTMVEFLDYRCGYCRRAHGEVAELIESDGNIRIVIKELPILGEQSMISSRFAIATLQIAGGNAYKSVHDALITMNGNLTDGRLRKLATGLGLDADAILARMDSAEVTQVINDNRALAQRLQINGTPSFVLEDRMLRGYLPLEQMREVVDAVRG